MIILSGRVTLPSRACIFGRSVVIESFECPGAARTAQSPGDRPAGWTAQPAHHRDRDDRFLAKIIAAAETEDIATVEVEASCAQPCDLGTAVARID